MVSYQHISIEKDGLFQFESVSDAIQSLIDEKENYLSTTIQTPTLVSFIFSLQKFDFFSKLGNTPKQETSIYLSDRENNYEVFAEGEVDRIYGNKAFEFHEVFALLQERLKNLSANTRFFGGFQFNQQADCQKDWCSFGSYQFVLPLYEIFQSKEKTTFTFNLLLNPAERLKEQIITKYKQLCGLLKNKTRYLYQPQPVLNRIDVPDCTGWKKMVSAALDAFKETSLEKIVLARKTTLAYSEDIPHFSFLQHLKEVVPSAFHFYFKFSDSLGFVGASPERLYKRQNQNLYTEAIAGTRLRGKNPQEDESLAQNLLNSEKDTREHDFVCESIKNILNDTCQTVDMKKQREILKLARVQHLHTQYCGKLKPGFSEADLISQLHPTPAVGGVPKKEAIQKILSLEPFNRGWYAGPIGWISPEGSEFTVGIRSALIEKNQLHVYTGAGIVEGSDPQEEWDEIENKLGSFFVTPSLNGHAECKT